MLKSRALAFTFIFGLVFGLPSFCNSAEASPVGISYAITGSSGDWTYNFAVTNNLGGTNDIYAIIISGLPTGGTSGSPAGWIVDTTYNPIEWCYGTCFAPSSNLIDGTTLSGFLVHDSAVNASYLLPWVVAAIGGNLGNAVFDGNAVGTLVPIPAALPLFAAGLSAIGFMGWRKKRKALA